MAKPEQSQFLLEVCRPYLLEILRVTIESLKYPEDTAHEVMEGKTWIPDEVVRDIFQMSGGQQTELMNDITEWLNSINKK
jgi:hypothetical protein